MKRIVRLKNNFVEIARITGVNIKVSDIILREYKKGDQHIPKSLLKGYMAVYTFHLENQCLKVGKVNSKSNARYQSQHYNPNSSSSNLANSILNDLIYDIDEHYVGDWIKENTDRIDFLLPDSYGALTLNLFEAFLQCALQPKYEGHSSQENK